MADEKITQQTADASPTTDDLVITVNDPGGTPANRKVTLGDVLDLAPGASGGTDVAVADGGTGASTAAAARTNLGAQEAISGATLTEVTPADDDNVVLQDTSDADNIKTSTPLAIVSEGRVKAALDGATTTAITPASGDKILALDASDTDNLKHVLFSEFGGVTVFDNFDSSLGSTRLAAADYHKITTGPFQATGTRAIAAGNYLLGLCYVRGGTPAKVAIRVSTAVSGDELYFVMYTADEELSPHDLHAEWGPFSTTSTGTVALTSQTETITPGLYWVGVFAPNTNSGSPATEGWWPSLAGPVRNDTSSRASIQIITTDTTPRASHTGVMRTNGSYEALDLYIAYFYGRDG